MNIIDNKTRACSIGFLIWLHALYGYRIERTYLELESDYGQCSLGTIRHYLLELRDAGYITIEKRGKCSQTFIINEGKYKELVKI